MNDATPAYSMTTDGPLTAYRARRHAGKLQPDPAQVLAAEKLQSLHNALKRYQPAMGKGRWRERLGLTRRREEPPQGLYMFGGVGRGKSMLMDLFYETAPVAAKRRVHFHEFMLDVHDRLHRARHRTAADGDPIPPLADDIAEEAWLLCFDEFHVGNIADAMLLGRLFGALFDRGVVMVATSNVAPDALYEGGLQRERFLPFIDLLKQRLDILELDGERDYRRARVKGMTVYHWPLGDAAEQALKDAFAQLTDKASGESTSLTVHGRRVMVPKAAKGVAWFAFADLCEQPLGAADYLAIATHFHTLILSGVPKMAAVNRNEARRFVTLVDALYEHKVNFICAAADAPEQLYATGEGALEFRRTSSRLMEMQSADYLACAHLP
ncbi:cell division protein ZapE [Virgifigura deserti]|uniref:cell division protein ZapE n=1 Tax=Virgifigura deserti TaxID=2268457 RepID=UPI003CCBDC50